MISEDYTKPTPFKEEASEGLFLLQWNGTPQPSRWDLFWGPGEESPVVDQTLNSGGMMQVLSWPWNTEPALYLKAEWKFAQSDIVCFVDLEMPFSHVPQGTLLGWYLRIEFGVMG